MMYARSMLCLHGTMMQTATKSHDMYQPIANLHFLVTKLEFSDDQLTWCNAKRFNLQLINKQRLVNWRFNRIWFGATGPYSDNKLTCCWCSLHYDKISNSSRSANSNCNPKYDLCKFYFTNRVVNTWNSVPSFVASAKTLNCFNRRLDEQPIILFITFVQKFNEMKSKVN